MLKVAFGFVALLTAAGCAGNARSAESGGGGAAVSGNSRGGAMPSGSGGTASSGGGTASSGGGTTSSSAGVAGNGSAAGAGGQSEVTSAGAAGSAATIGNCGGPSGITCPKGEFCDLASNCGAIPNATGFCAATGRVASCDDTEDPEGPSCGCEGKTYTNTCQRQELGMLRASLGICPNDKIASYEKKAETTRPWQ